MHKNTPDCVKDCPQLLYISHRRYIFFKRLEDHLIINLYNAAKIISISEDVTRLVGLVDYDKETDKMIDFVLVANENGMTTSLFTKPGVKCH